MATSSLTLLLKSNESPTPPDKQHILAILKEKQPPLVALQTKIAETKAMLQDFERHVPPEILAEIFLHLAPRLPLDHDPEVARLPWDLGLVCSSWRAVSLSLPQLWSTFDIRLPALCAPPTPRRGPWESDDQLYYPSPPMTTAGDRLEGGWQVEYTLGWITAAIRRCGNHPLRFRFWVASYAIGPLLGKLLKYSERWEEVFFVSEWESYVDQAHLHLDGHAFGALRKISFHGYGSVKCASLPNLCELYVDDVEDIDDLNVPWASLVGYSQRHGSWPTDLELSNLVLLRLDGHHASNIPSSGRMLLPRLRVACFRDSGGYRDYSGGRCDFVPLFDTPHLEACSISFVHDMPHDLTQFLPQSPHLRTLHVSIPATYGDFLLDTELLAALAAMSPDLTELAINVPGKVTSRFLREMSPSANNPSPLFPKLHTLRISRASLVDLDELWPTSLPDSFVSLLQARFNPSEIYSTSKLSTFYLPEICQSRDEAEPKEQSEEEQRMWGLIRAIHTALKKMREEKGWDVKFGDNCAMPRWDDLHLSDL
ncbi:hypothetical protein C8F01DRAFT_1255863 [Mycena amicta]|nr:hypothetical protein C8F01DRAFT_1255863 [Mycena amicta]